MIEYVDLDSMEICSKVFLLKKYKKSKVKGFDLSSQDLIDMNAGWLGVGQTPGDEATGKAVWIDDILVREFRPYTLDKLALIERRWRNSELTKSDVELFRVQDGHKSGKGLVSHWRTYRNDLRDYPEQEGFPDTTLAPRPVREAAA
jgi:hypothetical protein